jgi:hypothetical protein
VLRARTNIAHLYPTKTTRSALSATVCVISILLWVALFVGYSDSFPERTFGFLESPWNGRRQTETRTIIEICSSLFFICFLFSFFSFSFDFVSVCLVILLSFVFSRLVYLSSSCASRVTVDG